LSDSKTSGTAPVLARDLRVWVEELERLQRAEEQVGSGEFAASVERASELASRIRAHWKPGVGVGVAGAELLRPISQDDFYSTWQGSRPPAGASILVTLLDNASIGKGHLLLRFLDGMEAIEHLTRYGTASPHVARVTAVDESMLAWSSEFPEKGTFADGLGRGQPIRSKVALLEGAAKGIAHAHSQGVVHGGLRMESVGMRNDGTLFVYEFGLLRLAGDRLRSENDPRGPFAAPEIVAGAQPDPRSDVYSLGRLCIAVLFELDPRSNLSHRLDAVDLTVLPSDLGPVLHRATAVDPILRQANAQEFLRELQTGQVSMPLLASVASGELARPRPRWQQPVPLLIATVSLLVFIGVFVVPHWFVPEPGSDPRPPRRATPTPVAEATASPTPTPSVTRDDLEEGLSRYLPADAVDPYASFGDEALSARLLFLDQAAGLRDKVAASVSALWESESDPATLALMAWTLERRGLEPELVEGIRSKLGQDRRRVRVGGVDVEFARTAGDPEVWVGTREVSQAQWSALREDAPSFFLGSERPVETVSWCDALAFTNAFSAALSVEPAYSGVEECVSSGGRSVQWNEQALGARLPTGAEWDAAALAGVSRRSWVGDPDPAILRVGWLAPNAGNKTHVVGSLPESPWGLADVHGNVAEWIWEPPNDPSSEVRWVSVRGGSWRSRARDARSGERAPKRPEARESDVGLRLLWVGELPAFTGDDDSAEGAAPE
jgi:hypothetical protein